MADNKELRDVPLGFYTTASAEKAIKEAAWLERTTVSTLIHTVMLEHAREIVSRKKATSPVVAEEA